MGEKQTKENEESDTDQAEAQKVLLNDSLFKALVVQRSRAYVKKSQEQNGGSQVIFPTREQPQVVQYSMKIVYGRLLEMVEKAFAKDKPLFSLAMYYPLAYAKKPADNPDVKESFDINRQKQLVRLIRILFLKRFESSGICLPIFLPGAVIKNAGFCY